MRKVLLSVLFFTIISSCYCQEEKPVPEFSAIHYQKKARYQKITGALLLVSGAFVFCSPIVNAFDGYLSGDPADLNAVKNFAIGGTLMAASVPFFFFSQKNKVKAKSMSTSFIKERIPILKGQNFAEGYYYAVSLKFSF